MCIWCVQCCAVLCWRVHKVHGFYFIRLGSWFHLLLAERNVCMSAHSLHLGVCNARLRASESEKKRAYYSHNFRCKCLRLHIDVQVVERYAVGEKLKQALYVWLCKYLVSMAFSLDATHKYVLQST